MTHYQVLNISKTARFEEIQKAYRKLAKKYHPDVSKDPQASKKMQQVNEAYSILKDASKRAEYNKSLEPKKSIKKTTSKKSNSSPDFWDTFTSAPRGGNRGSGGFSQTFGVDMDAIRGKDLHADVTITHAQAKQGCRHRIKFEEVYTCWACMGAGGSYIPLGHDLYFDSGCSYCNNSGELTDTKIIDVSIPAGTEHNQTLRVKHKGSSYDVDIPGDLYLHITLYTPPTERKYSSLKDLDVYIKHKLDLTKAYKGGVEKITSPSGSVRIRIKKRTYPGKVYFIKHQGHYNTQTGELGNMYVEIEVNYPKNPTEDEWNMINELNEATHTNPKSND